MRITRCTLLGLVLLLVACGEGGVDWNAPENLVLREKSAKVNEGVQLESTLAAGHEEQHQAEQGAPRDPHGPSSVQKKRWMAAGPRLTPPSTCGQRAGARGWGPPCPLVLRSAHGGRSRAAEGHRLLAQSDHRARGAAPR